MSQLEFLDVHSLEMLWSEFDIDMSGTLDLAEFVSMHIKISEILKAEKVMRVFWHILDKNSDGYLAIDEFMSP